MTDGAASAVEVFVFQAGRFLGSRCFTQSTVVIGSGPEAALRLRDSSILARHAVLRIKGGSLVLASNSEAGGQVLVNGESISVRQVHSFDEIRIGTFRLKLTLLGGQTAEDPIGSQVAEPPAARPGGLPATETEPTAAHAQAYAPRAEHPTSPVEAGARHFGDGPNWGADPEDAPTRRHAPSDEMRRDELGREFDDDSVTRLRRRRGGDKRAPAAAAGAFDASSALSQSSERAQPEHFAYDAAGHSAAGYSTDRRAVDDAAHGYGTTGSAQETTVPEDAETRAFTAGPMGFDDETGAYAAHGHDFAEAPPTRRDPAKAAADPIAAYGSPADSPAPPGPDTERVRTLDQDSALDPHDEDDDEDDDEEPFVEPFSLLENIVRERFKSLTTTEPYAMIEVIRYRSGELLDLTSAKPGQDIRLAPDNFRLLRVRDDGQAELYFRPDFSGSVVRDGKARPLGRLAQPDTLVDPRKQIHRVQLREGDYAQIVREEGGYLARFVRPPTVPRATMSFRFDLSKIQVFAGSAAFHFLILVLLGFVAPQADLYPEAEQERFAKLSVKDLKLEKPKEEPKPEAPPPKEPEPPKDEAPKPTPPKEQPRPQRRVRRVNPAEQRQAQQRAQQQAQQQQQKKQVANVLGALQNVAPQGGRERSDLKSLVTNIKAVRAPSGTGSGFKIAGTIDKLPGKSIQLAGLGGGGGKDTRVGSQLLAGTQIGSMKAIAGTGTRVRGRAAKAPTRAIGTTGGVLSREAIQKVVTSHMARIQACYERQLLLNRGLAGKIVFDWVISPAGSVSSARQASSSLASAAVSSCILGEIRSWRFPHPVGGAVQVRYPFVFRVQGF